jgi:hypothetical protein
LSVRKEEKGAASRIRAKRDCGGRDDEVGVGVGGGGSRGYEGRGNGCVAAAATGLRELADSWYEAVGG